VIDAETRVNRRPDQLEGTGVNWLANSSASGHAVGEPSRFADCRRWIIISASCSKRLSQES